MWGFIAGLGIFIILLLIIFTILPLTLWIWQMVRLSKRKDKTGLWIVLGLGLALFLFGFVLGGFFWGPLIAGIVGLFLGRGEEKIELEYFWCGICNIKYQNDFLGGETAHEGKICRSCLGKKQRGETTTPSENQPRSTSYTPVYHEPQYRPKDSREVGSGEKRILLRELGRKQSKKNSYLTQFIINLAVLQWLLPLITYFIYWIQLKDKMKAQVLNNPGTGLSAEIPFSTLVKDFFKILTSETYDYGGYKILISLTWKIGIIVAFLLPLGIWIYNLVRFFGAKGEVERLETEIKAL